MGLFNFFKKKPQNSDEARLNFLNSIISKYFEGSKQKWLDEASHLLEITKFDITTEEMATLILRCLGFRQLKGGDWNETTARALRNDCSGKLPDVELRWLLVYCDVHYINKDPELEALVLFEQAGRQIGMPSPTGDISPTYKFK